MAYTGRHEAGNDNINVCILSGPIDGGRSALTEIMGKINLSSVDGLGKTDRHLRTKHSGWMSANRAGRTPSPGDVCPVLPRRLIQMKDDPRLEPFGRRRQFSKLRFVAVDVKLG